MINPFRLANEWRDSLGLTTLIALMMAGGHSMAGIVVLTIGLREIHRDIAWRTHPPMRIIGDTSMPNNRDVSDGSAILSGIAFSTYWILLVSADFPLAIRLFFAGATGVIFGMDLARIFAVRRSNTTRIRKAWVQAWDWPRKRGGPTETQKLADIAARLGQSLRPAATEA